MVSQKGRGRSQLVRRKLSPTSSKQQRTPLIESESINDQNTRGRRVPSQTPPLLRKSVNTGLKSEKENQSEPGSNGNVSLALVKVNNQRKSAGGSSEKPSRFPSIRSPEHWTLFPKIIGGAITEVTQRINDESLRDKVVATLIDVMNNKNSLLGSYREHFNTTNRSASVPRPFLDKARDLLKEHLGFDELPENIASLINENTTYEELKEILGIRETYLQPTILKPGRNVVKPKSKEEMSEDLDETPKKSKQRLHKKFSIDNAIHAYKPTEKPVFKTPQLPIKRRSGSVMDSAGGSADDKRARSGHQNTSDSSLERGTPNASAQISSKIGGILSSGGPMQLLTAPIRERRRFRGTPDELRREIRSVLDGNYAGNLDDMVTVLTEAVLKEHRMAKILNDHSIPFELMIATFNFCTRFLALENIELVEEGQE